jgi:hypothetical protein
VSRADMAPHQEVWFDDYYHLMKKRALAAKA